MPLIELLSGPHDGELLSRAAKPGPLAWLDDSMKFHREPGEGRDLYRVRGAREAVAGGKVVIYEFVQHQQVRCGGCGWIVPRGDSECPLCSAALAA